MGDSFAFIVDRFLIPSLIAKTTFLLMISLGACRAMSRSSASVRHVVLASALAMTLVLPFAMLAVPSRYYNFRTVTAEEPTVTRSTALRSGDRPFKSNAESDAVGLGQRGVLTVTDIVVTVWFAGALLFLIPVAAGLRQVLVLRRLGTPWALGQRILDGIAVQRGSASTIVIKHNLLSTPLTCGWLRPVIAFPAGAVEWSENDLRRALLHEFEHVRRRDWPIICFARIICALYWFNPLVWLAWRRLRLEAERSCDDVVALTEGASEYAELLVSVARNCRRPDCVPLTAMAGRRDLVARVNYVLDVTQSRRRATARETILAVSTAAAITLGVAPLSGRVVQDAGVPSNGPRFDAISIRPHSGSNSATIPRQLPDGGFSLTNGTVALLLGQSYPVFVWEIVGLPDWVESEHYDVVASGDPEFPKPTQSQRAVMIRAMLADRFGLVAHYERRQQPAYDLVMAKDDGQLGPNITPVRDIDCAAERRKAEVDEQKRNVLRPSIAGALPSCTYRMRGDQLEGDITLDVLTGLLRNNLKRAVIDKTGLSGFYRVGFTFAPVALTAGTNSAPSGEATVFTALREQLGMKLESTRAAVEVLVVDRIERPTPN